jgi:hypothetical protein
MEKLKLTIQRPIDDENIVIDLSSIPNAAHYLFCYREPKGFKSIPRKYLSGYDFENAAYEIQVSDILDADYSVRLDTGMTALEHLGKEWEKVLEKLQSYRGEKIVASNI